MPSTPPPSPPPSSTPPPSGSHRLLAISGMPGSGKSMLACALGHTLAAPVVAIDTHYRPGATDFHDPASLDLHGVLSHIEGHWAGGAAVVIVESIFALTLDALRARACLTIWLDVPLDIALARKLLRKLDSGADIAPSIHGYLAQGRDGYLKNVLPGRDHADLCLDATQPVDDLTGHVMAHLHNKALP
jgi:uridine kinase